MTIGTILLVMLVLYRLFHVPNEVPFFVLVRHSAFR